MPTEQQAEASRVLIVGLGDLGQALAETLLADGLHVLGLRRSKHSHHDNIQMLFGDVTQPDSLACLRETDPDILVYCVAATEQSDSNYRAHYVEGLRHTLHALAEAKHLRHVFFVSSTRVYGQVTEALLTENDPAIPADFGGQRLLEAEQLLESLPCGHTALRLSGIYGPGRNRMLTLAASPANWPQQNTWTNRIHRDDAAAFIAFLIGQVLRGEQVHDCYITTDSCPVPQHEVLFWLAAKIGSNDAPCATPAKVSGGKRLSNQRLLSSGYSLRYPDYRSGYTALLEATPR